MIPKELNNYDIMNSKKNDIIELEMMKKVSGRKISQEPIKKQYSNECNDDRPNLTEIINVEKKRKFVQLLGRAVDSYVNFIVPYKRHAYTAAGHEERDIDGVDIARTGKYVKKYLARSAMTIISIIQVACFVADETVKHFNTGVTNGPVNSIFQYDLYNRQECWRFFTYMLVHSGYIHLSTNLLVQFFLSIPLEKSNQWWRVLIVYFSGVIAGSLATSIIEPTRYLVGGSGGGCALTFAHLSNLVLNWSDLEFVWVRLLVIILISVPDIGLALYNRHSSNQDQNIAWTAHIGGAVAGLLVGFWILKNVEPTKKTSSGWRCLQWVTLILFISLMVIAITLNICWTDHFSKLTG